MRQQFVELLDRVHSDSGEHVLKPSERVDLREFAGCDEAAQHCHGPAATIAAYESPVIPANGDAAQLALCVVIIDG